MLGTVQSGMVKCYSLSVAYSITHIEYIMQLYGGRIVKVLIVSI
jgi:hypothetical protein